MSLNSANIGLSLQQKLEDLSPKKSPYPEAEEAQNDASVDDLSSLAKYSNKMDSKRDEEVIEFANSKAAPPAKTICGVEGATFGLYAILSLIAICAILMVAELGSLVSFASQTNNTPANIYVGGTSGSGVVTEINSGESTVDNVPDFMPPATSGTNVCAGKKPKLDNVECIVDAMTNVGPQAGANVTKGYNGSMPVDYVPITTPYWQNGMCPVNVHWHLGAEHYSAGEFDENGSGPAFPEQVDGGIRPGYQCTAYDANDSKFTKPFEWKHCENMEVGQTYEVHWPHSAAGACGTPNQYQTPFYDGVFCVDDVLTDTAKQIGVQAQIVTVVNDEAYFWPDFMRGMIVDSEAGYGQDVAMYTGSTTGDARNNEICSQYSPITWQVDRKCQLVSASTFDKMCADMKMQRDDMSSDLYPHGSRPLVADELAAANHANRFLRA